MIWIFLNSDSAIQRFSDSAIQLFKRLILFLADSSYRFVILTIGIIGIREGKNDYPTNSYFIENKDIFQKTKDYLDEPP